MKTNNHINRWSPLKLKNITIKNRIVVPPMASGTANSEGFATVETEKHYQRLLKSNPGILIVEYTYVHLSGRSEPNQLGIHTNEHIEALAKLARLIKSTGTLAGIQLTHAGGKTSKEYTGGKLMGPSSIAVPVKDNNLEVPKEMSEEDILIWKMSFLEAAKRAILAGFDLIEIHSAHGYGMNQWLSPITNHRSDDYGGSLIKRMRLLKEIISLIRGNYPQILISVRMPGQDFLDGGISTEDGIFIAKELEKEGVDILNVSSGIGGWMRPRERRGEGYLVGESEAILANVSLPVIGVGGIQSGHYIDHGLTHQKFSLAAIGRAILDDPEKWYTDHMQLKEENQDLGPDYCAH